MANNTKWREFFTEVIAQKIPVDVKLLYEEFPFECRSVWSPSTNYIEGTGMGPELFVFIEWVRSGEAVKVSSIAATAGLEYETHDDIAKIFGYR